ncbi:hypothetical protein [Zoogloea sp.]|uniref:hypothetical protein n=1 Tax=Zoogloea sp. TaxID=49181 RepID=UPI0035AF0DFC
MSHPEVVQRPAASLPRRLITYLKVRAGEEDKQKHFLYSLAIQLFFMAAGFDAWTSAVLTLAVGYAKEIWDEHFGSGFCWHDQFANLIGVIYAIGLWHIPALGHWAT